MNCFLMTLAFALGIGISANALSDKVGILVLE